MKRAKTGMQIVSITREEMQKGFVLPGGTVVHDWVVADDHNIFESDLFIMSPVPYRRCLYLKIEHEYSQRHEPGQFLLIEPLDNFLRRIEELTLKRAAGWVPEWEKDNVD